MVHLNQVATTEDLAHVRHLLREYADTPGSESPIAGFDAELAGLPGEYSHPGGCLLLAFAENMPVGCVALRRIDDHLCEMRRLYVKPPFRREGVGRKLTLKVIEFARTAGYARMFLDTLPPMVEATSLYRSLGFKETDPHKSDNGERGLSMELHLR